MKGALKTMFLAKLKLAVGTFVIVAALGASSLAYRAAGQAQAPTPEKRAAGKPLTEVEALRRENELLKLNLEVVLEKVRAQEAELRALKGRKGAGPDLPYVNQLPRNGRPPSNPNPKPKEGQSDNSGAKSADRSLDSPRPMSDDQYRFRDQSVPPDKQPSNHADRERRPTAKTDPTQQVENALKWLGKGCDPEAMLRALDALEKAVKQMREELKKQGNHRQERPSDTTPPGSNSRPARR
jgi:hypothetical protein